MALSVGTQLINFELPSTNGMVCGPADYADKDVLVVVFTCNHCPYVLAWEDRLIQAQKDYAEKGVQFLLICANDAEKYPADSFEEMQKRAQEKAYPFPYLHDESQEIARAYGATRTPEIFVFDHNRVLRYHGTVDDNYEDPAAVQQHYMRAAIEALLSGQEPPVAATDPVGCSIKWK
ncbi:MAG: thioredoxin family protein [Phototrophicales bacterium]|nr:MAG: thioredoxin family protein [Phototrophicales bacterium]